MTDSAYYLPAGILAVALLSKVPSLRHGWRDGMLRAACTLIALGACAFFFSAPPTVAQVNSWTGIANVSAPFVYSLLAAFNCACLVLLIHWRGGDAASIRAQARVWIAATVGIIAVLMALFALGDAPIERQRDMDTYYATAPYIREMVVVYLLAHAVVGMVVTVTCFRWARQVPQVWLKRGLATIAAGFVANLAFASGKLVAVAARWAGGNWDGLSTDAAPQLASVGASLIAVGFLLPLVGPWGESLWGDWRTYRRMYPLWRALHQSSRFASTLQVPFWAVSDRTLARAVGIADRLLELRPHLDPRTSSCAQERAEEAGMTQAEAQLVGEATMIRVALLGLDSPSTSESHDRTDLARRFAPGDFQRIAELSTAFTKIENAPESRHHAHI